MFISPTKIYYYLLSLLSTLLLPNHWSAYKEYNSDKEHHVLTLFDDMLLCLIIEKLTLNSTYYFILKQTRASANCI